MHSIECYVNIKSKENVCSSSGALLLHSTGKADNIAHGRDLILETLKNGKALNRFEKMLINQKVQPGVAYELCHGKAESVLPKEKFSSPLVTSASGIVDYVDITTSQYLPRLIPLTFENKKKATSLILMRLPLLKCVAHSEQLGLGLPILFCQLLEFNSMSRWDRPSMRAKFGDN